MRILRKYTCYQFRVPRNLRIDIKDRLEEYSQSIPTVTSILRLSELPFDQANKEVWLNRNQVPQSHSEF